MDAVTPPVAEPAACFEPRGLRVPATGTATLLELAQSAGLRVPHSCRGGSCGSCRMRLVAGEVAYPRFAPALPPGLLVAEAGSGEVLACQAVPLGSVTVEVRELRRVDEVEVRKLPCRVARLVRLAPEVLGLWLRLPAAEPLAFRAGQYVNLWLPDGRPRSFSIASPPHDAALLELHLRETPGLQPALEKLAEGSLLTVEGPFGELASALDDTAASAGPLLLVAGGTGYAPMQSLLRHVLEAGGGRPLHLYWGGRDLAALYRHEWLVARTHAFTQFRYTPVLSGEAAAAGVRHGLVHEAVMADHSSLAGHSVIAAGPTVMVDALRAAAVARGLPAASFASDAYG